MEKAISRNGLGYYSNKMIAVLNRRPQGW